MKAYRFTALVFMIVATGISSRVHFLLLTVSRQIEATIFFGRTQPWSEES